jgi:lysophospholipase L1-like esterase
MKRIAPTSLALLAALAAVLATPATAAKSRKSAPKKTAVPQGKRYLSSTGKSAAKSAPKSAAKSGAKSASKAKAPVNVARAAAAAKARANAQNHVYRNVADAAGIPVENAAALIPFFEQLYRHQKGEMQGPVRILHYGDSHTAADEWTAALRARFKERFGDGGSGYSLAGRPFSGYRHRDVRTGSTRGWHSDGLVGRRGDGVYGLGGVSMTTTLPREAVFLDADAASFELFYYQQPGGGTLQLFDNGTPVEQIPTDGEPGPAYYRLDTAPGPHRLELETLDRAPVRLFGWVAENPTGITYEPLGINGAQASIVLDWNEPALRSNLERRDPALIVLAYGTNEAGNKDWTLDSYREMFSRLLAGFRAAAPTATILVIGPPDRQLRTRKGWVALDRLDMIVQAQREAAYAAGSPFWDLRAKMGGKGSIARWVSAGMAQRDRVHFTAPGYRLLGEAVFRDLMSQYEIFLKARADILADAAADGTQVGN